MGWLGNLFGGGDTIRGTLEGAGTLARDVRAAVTGQIDPERLAELQAQAIEIEAKIATAQSEINKAEAQSTNWFVAGWRPAIGWCGAFALAYKYLARPIATGFGADMPDIETAALWPIITGMMGLGAVRTIEKNNGVQDRH